MHSFYSLTFISIIISIVISIVGANIYYDLSDEQYLEVKNSRNFTGKVVLVTGSSSGFGEGIVKLFSILGANVVITGRNESRIKIVAQEVHKLSPYGLQVMLLKRELIFTKIIFLIISSLWK